MMNTNAQIFLDQLSAATTHFACVAWIDLHCTSTSVFSFVRGELDKLTPCRVCDGFSQTMIFEHPSDVQLFKYDDGKSIDQLPAFLMGKISAFVGDSLVNVGNYFAAFLSLWTAFCSRAQFALSLCQSLFIFAKEFRIGNSFTVRQHGKLFQANVNAYAFFRFGKGCASHSTDKQAYHLPVELRADGQRLDFAFNRAMQFDFDFADFRQLEFARSIANPDCGR